MNPDILRTILISSIVYWGILIVGIIISLISAKRDRFKEKHKNPEETTHEKVYCGLCLFFDVLGGFIVYLICGFLIALFVKFVLLKIILFIPVGYISLQFAQRIMPYIVNRSLGKVMGIDNEISG